MTNQILKVLAIFLSSVVIFSCVEEPNEPVIDDEEGVEIARLPMENFISSFEQVVAGPYGWYWEFEHQYSGDIVTTTKVNDALFGDFGRKSILQYSHKFDSNGNIEYSIIERGPVLNDAAYYVYELDEKGFIKTIQVKDDPEGRIIYVWRYTYDEEKRLISKNINRGLVGIQNTESFSYNENGDVVNWEIERGFDNSLGEKSFSFNDQGQLTRFLSPREFGLAENLELTYNNLGNISSYEEIKLDTSFMIKVEYSSDSLMVTRDAGMRNNWYGQNMTFQKGRIQVEADDASFVVEGSLKEGDQQVVEEQYFEIVDGEHIPKGTREFSLVIDSNGDLVRDRNEGLRFYDLEGDLAFTYSWVGNNLTQVWYSSNGERVETLATLPDWVRNLAGSHITYRSSISFFNAASYNTISW